MNANAFEVHIERLHVDDSLLAGDGPRPRIDPVRWRPLVMSFCRFFGLGGEVHSSRLAESDFMKFAANRPRTRAGGLSPFRAPGRAAMIPLELQGGGARRVSLTRGASIQTAPAWRSSKCR